MKFLTDIYCNGYWDYMPQMQPWMAENFKRHESDFQARSDDRIKFFNLNHILFAYQWNHQAIDGCKSLFNWTDPAAPRVNCLRSCGQKYESVFQFLVPHNISGEKDQSHGSIQTCFKGLRRFARSSQLFLWGSGTTAIFFSKSRQYKWFSLGCAKNGELM